MENVPKENKSKNPRGKCYSCDKPCDTYFCNSVCENEYFANRKNLDTRRMSGAELREKVLKLRDKLKEEHKLTPVNEQMKLSEELPLDNID